MTIPGPTEEETIEELKSEINMWKTDLKHAHLLLKDRDNEITILISKVELLDKENKELKNKLENHEF